MTPFILHYVYPAEGLKTLLAALHCDLQMAMIALWYAQVLCSV